MYFDDDVKTSWRTTGEMKMKERIEGGKFIKITFSVKYEEISEEITASLSCQCESISSFHASIINTQWNVPIANYGFSPSIHLQTTVYYDFRVNKNNFLWQGSNENHLKRNWKNTNHSSMSMIFNFPLIGCSFLWRVKKGDGGRRKEAKMNEK